MNICSNCQSYLSKKYVRGWGMIVNIIVLFAHNQLQSLRAPLIACGNSVVGLL